MSALTAEAYLRELIIKAKVDLYPPVQQAAAALESFLGQHSKPEADDLHTCGVGYRKNNCPVVEQAARAAGWGR